MEQLKSADKELKLFVSAATLTTSAAVVFARSIVDDIATQACRVIAEVEPEAWDIDNKTVPLGDLKSKTSEQVRRGILDKYIGSLGRESLDKSVSEVLKKCPDQPCQLIIDDLPYEFDMRLDRLRQDIIHRVVIRKRMSRL